MNSNVKVPYAKSSHGSDEIAAVTRVLNSATQMGHEVEEFEKSVAEIMGHRFGIMVNSGSSANFLSLQVLKFKPGSEIITPALTFSTTVAPIIQNQLIPRFVDVDSQTFNINCDQLESALTPKTVALMVPNLIGNLPDWEKLREFANEHKLILIEDSCDTIGCQYKNLPTGHYANLSTSSFYGSHIINCAGNGGILCVNDNRLEEEARLLRSWGRRSSLHKDSEKHESRFNIKIGDMDYDAKFVFDQIGFNFEPSEMGAAFGRVQLKKLNQFIQIRQQNFSSHIEFFKGYEDFFQLPIQDDHSETAWLAFPLTIKRSAPFNRKQLQIFFEQNGIQTRTVLAGNILRQPGFIDYCSHQEPDSFPEADKVMSGGFMVGLHQELSKIQMEHIWEITEDFVRKHK